MLYVWAVVLVIQNTLITIVGPYGMYNSCDTMKEVIIEDITRDFEPYDGTTWGLSNNVTFDDYKIECIRLNIGL